MSLFLIPGARVSGEVTHISWSSPSRGTDSLLKYILKLTLTDGTKIDIRSAKSDAEVEKHDHVTAVLNKLENNSKYGAQWETTGLLGVKLPNDANRVRERLREKLHYSQPEAKKLYDKFTRQRTVDKDCEDFWVYLLSTETDGRLQTYLEQKRIPLPANGKIEEFRKHLQTVLNYAKVYLPVVPESELETLSKNVQAFAAQFGIKCENAAKSLETDPLLLLGCDKPADSKRVIELVKLYAQGIRCAPDASASTVALLDTIQQLQKAKECGSVCLPLQLLSKLLFQCDSVQHARYIQVTCDAVFLKRNFETEHKCASILTSFRHGEALLDCDEEAKKEIELALSGCTMKVSEEQKAAIKTALLNPVSILVGPGGSGKTTVVSVLQRVLRSIDHNAKCLLLAPTGRAAVNLQSAKLPGSVACTIHSMYFNSKALDDYLLGKRKRDCDDVEQTFEEGFDINEVEHSNIKQALNSLQGASHLLVVIDEMSMVSNSLFALLLGELNRSTWPNVTVVLVGDPIQLPSIEAGDVLFQLLKSNLPKTELKTIHRQDETAFQLKSVIRNVRDGNIIKLPLVQGNDRSFTAELISSKSEACDSVFKSVLAFLKQGLKLSDILVVCPKRDIRDAVNNYLQERLNPPSVGSRTATFKASKNFFRVGDIVMAKKNLQNGVMNGMRGVVTAIDVEAKQANSTKDSTINICVDFWNSTTTFYAVSAEKDKTGTDYVMTSYPDLELGYAITVHAAQGSQAPAVILAHDYSSGEFLNQRMAYTAVSRAVRLLHTIHIGERWLWSCWIEPAPTRHSRLCEMLNELSE